MNFVRKILFPIVPIYYLVTWLRNLCYDISIFKSKSYNFPIICVGNLSTGGTGKTPLIEYLIRLLKGNYKVATLNRGYKRNTKGFYIADANSSAQTIGDEPFQFHQKFDNIVVSVDENRQNGISQLRQLSNIPDIILLDDAFQHRKVKAGLNILLTSYDKLYVDDFMLPTGNLRESKAGAKRAQIIVVTKCPDNLTDSKKQAITKRINPETFQHVFFSAISYGKEVLSENNSLELYKLQNFTLVTGIANPIPLLYFLKSKSLKFEHLNFKDHHEFSIQDIQNFERKELIITTEKDFVRLKQYQSLKDKLYHLPIEIIIEKDKIFDALINNYINNR